MARRISAYSWRFIEEDEGDEAINFAIERNHCSELVSQLRELSVGEEYFLPLTKVPQGSPRYYNDPPISSSQLPLTYFKGIEFQLVESQDRPSLLCSGRQLFWLSNRIDLVDFLAKMNAATTSLYPESNALTIDYLSEDGAIQSMSQYFWNCVDASIIYA